MSYSFTIGKHAQQAHDYVSALIDGAYSRKNAGNPMTPSERVNSAQSICESYFEHVGQQPPSAVLSRLAWYIDFDHMTDSHPDKMTREEIPVMSGGQTKRYFEKAKIKSAVEAREDALVGRQKRAFVTDDGANWVTSSPMVIPSDGELDAAEWRAFIESILSAREYAIVQRYYGDGATQGEIAAELGVSRQRVGVVMRSAFDKISRSIAI